MALLHKHQMDDVFFLDITIAILYLLNDKLFINNVISDTETVQHKIPFFYNAGGDERFLQDVFLSQAMNDMIDTKIVEGNIDVIPRGSITLSSIAIQESNLTNRFIYGEFLQEIDGIQEKMVAPTNVIPLELNYECEIKLDTKLNTFKCASKLIKTFYRAHAFKFLSEGYTLEANVSFPSDVQNENTYEFSFGDVIDNSIKFQLAVETYLPVVDETQIRKKINIIESFEINYEVINGLFNKNKDNIDSSISIINSGIIIDDNESISTLNNSNSNSIYIVDNYIENNIDNNLHHVDNFGIPTDTLNNDKKFKK